MDFGFSCPVFPEIAPPWCEFYCALATSVLLQRCWLNVFCDKRGRIQCCSGSGCGWRVGADLSCLKRRVVSRGLNHGRSTAQFSVPDETVVRWDAKAQAKVWLLGVSLAEFFHCQWLDRWLNIWIICIRHFLIAVVSRAHGGSGTLQKKYLETKHTACHVTMKCYDGGVILKCILVQNWSVASNDFMFQLLDFASLVGFGRCTWPLGFRTLLLQVFYGNTGLPFEGGYWSARWHVDTG